MVKFAVSSSRHRRVGPFRRLQERINHPEGEFNDLRAPRGDQAATFMLMYTGATDHDHLPLAQYPDGLTMDNAVICGPSTYRPLPAAYALAMTERLEPALHRFHHGSRPRYHGVVETANGGVEIYYQSRSFLLSAGGMFLNSGYGNDEIDFVPGIEAFAQTARAQATTLILTRADDLTFADLIRFDPFPDPANPPSAEEPIDGRATNTGVHRGVACGANLRIPDKWHRLAPPVSAGRWLFFDQDLPGYGPLGCYVAAYRTPVAEPFDLDPVPDNLGILFVVEADRLEFTTFAAGSSSATRTCRTSWGTARSTKSRRSTGARCGAGCSPRWSPTGPERST